jgi:hypothetical protein
VAWLLLSPSAPVRLRISPSLLRFLIPYLISRQRLFPIRPPRLILFRPLRLILLWFLCLIPSWLRPR